MAFPGKPRSSPSARPSPPRLMPVRWYDHRDQADRDRCAAIRWRSASVRWHGGRRIAPLVALTQLGLVRVFGSTALWAARDATRFQYLVEFRRELPLFAAAAARLRLAGSRRRNRAAGWCCCSRWCLWSRPHCWCTRVASAETMRYVYYGSCRGYCVLWAVALAETVDRWPESRLAAAAARRAARRHHGAVGGACAPWTCSPATSTALGDARPSAPSRLVGALPCLVAWRTTPRGAITSEFDEWRFYYLGRSYDLEPNDDHRAWRLTLRPSSDGMSAPAGGVTSRPESSAARSRAGDSLVVLETRRSVVPAYALTEAFDVTRAAAWRSPPESTLLAPGVRRRALISARERSRRARQCLVRSGRSVLTSADVRTGL